MRWRGEREREGARMENWGFSHQPPKQRKAEEKEDDRQTEDQKKEVKEREIREKKERDIDEI